MPRDLTLPGLGPVHHRAYLVESIEDTVARLVEQFGAGPFFVLENVTFENVTSRGEVAEFSHNSAFGHLGGDPIELMEIKQLSPARVAERLRNAFRGRVRGCITSPGRCRRPRSSRFASRSRRTARPLICRPTSMTSTAASTTARPRSATMSRSTPTWRACRASSQCSARPPRTGMARIQSARRSPEPARPGAAAVPAPERYRNSSTPLPLCSSIPYVSM